MSAERIILSREKKRETEFLSMAGSIAVYSPRRAIAWPQCSASEKKHTNKGAPDLTYTHTTNTYAHKTTRIAKNKHARTHTLKTAPP